MESLKSGQLLSLEKMVEIIILASPILLRKK